MDFMDICTRCAQWRLECGYTQKHIADKLNVSPETISAFEHGRTNNARVLSWYIEHGFKL